MSFDLERYEIGVETVIRNAAPARLYEDAIVNEGAAVVSSGAIVVRSGAKTGRSPLDKRIVDHPASSEDIWWGPINIKLSEDVFIINRQRAVDYLNTRESVYVLDGFAGWDPRERLKIRVICARA
ncbi:MAG TPA: phosphoenolpyruvate carboxykinase (ATP), partial [Pirellulales bacterium]|nr:phosphoenolpyruvate carboxykinase (ATP) [Pirellulales bacterium]